MLTTSVYAWLPRRSYSRKDDGSNATHDYVAVLRLSTPGHKLTESKHTRISEELKCNVLNCKSQRILTMRDSGEDDDTLCILRAH
jgi:hypothetical protein